MVLRILNPNSKPFLKKHIVNKVLVEIKPQHLYSIVTDVDSYQSFLPFCKASQILRRSDCGTMFDAMLKIGITDLPPLNSIEESYVSRVRHLQREKLDGRGREWVVEAKSIKSHLFHGLSSSWKISSEDGEDVGISEWVNENDPVHSCGNIGDTFALTKVEFQVEMSVEDPWIAAALDHVLESVALKQVEAFEKRCREIPYSRE